MIYIHMHICTSYCVQYLHLPSRLLCKGMPYERGSLLPLPAVWCLYIYEQEREKPLDIWSCLQFPNGIWQKSFAIGQVPVKNVFMEVLPPHACHIFALQSTGKINHGMNCILFLVSKEECSVEEEDNLITLFLFKRGVSWGEIPSRWTRPWRGKRSCCPWPVFCRWLGFSTAVRSWCVGMFLKERNPSCDWHSRQMDLKSRLFPPGAAPMLERHSETRSPKHSETASLPPWMPRPLVALACSWTDPWFKSCVVKKTLAKVSSCPASILSRRCSHHGLSTARAVGMNGCWKGDLRWLERPTYGAHKPWKHLIFCMQTF